MGKNKIDKELVLSKNYDNYSEYYSDCIEIIYLNIIDIFETFKNTRKRKITFLVKSKVLNMEWDTEFQFTNKDHLILTRDILPYFEKNENFEMCQKIKILVDYLKK